jgi:hypothetical protein
MERGHFPGLFPVIIISVVTPSANSGLRMHATGQWAKSMRHQEPRDQSAPRFPLDDE